MPVRDEAGTPIHGTLSTVSLHLLLPNPSHETCKIQETLHRFAEFHLDGSTRLLWTAWSVWLSFWRPTRLLQQWLARTFSVRLVACLPPRFHRQSPSPEVDDFQELRSFQKTDQTNQFSENTNSCSKEVLNFEFYTVDFSGIFNRSTNAHYLTTFWP